MFVKNPHYYEGKFNPHILHSLIPAFLHPDRWWICSMPWDQRLWWSQAQIYRHLWEMTTWLLWEATEKVSEGLLPYLCSLLHCLCLQLLLEEEIPSGPSAWKKHWFLSEPLSCSNKYQEWWDWGCSMRVGRSWVWSALAGLCPHPWDLNKVSRTVPVTVQSQGGKAGLRWIWKIHKYIRTAGLYTGISAPGLSSVQLLGRGGGGCPRQGLLGLLQPLVLTLVVRV